MKDMYKRFKKLTSFSYADIAKRLGVSRQAVEKMLSNYSITYINANKWILTKMIDESIDKHQEEIKQLQALRREIEQFERIQ